MFLQIIITPTGIMLFQICPELDVSSYGSPNEAAIGASGQSLRDFL
jgi:hypothetical protein